MLQGADKGKIGKLRSMGANVMLHGTDCMEAEARARQEAHSRQGVYISPYNDLQACWLSTDLHAALPTWLLSPAQVAGGQGTLAVELLQQLAPDQVDAAYIAVGGGGLISGACSLVWAHRRKAFHAAVH